MVGPNAHALENEVLRLTTAAVPTKKGFLTSHDEENSNFWHITVFCHFLQSALHNLKRLPRQLARRRQNDAVPVDVMAHRQEKKGSPIFGKRRLLSVSY